MSVAKFRFGVLSLSLPDEDHADEIKLVPSEKAIEISFVRARPDDPKAFLSRAEARTLADELLAWAGPRRTK